MPRFSFQQQVLTGFIVTLIFVFSGALIAYHRIYELQNDSRSVDRTQEVIKFTNQVLINVVQAESSVRGLTATGNKTYLDAYNENLSKISPSVDRLASLLRDDTHQSVLADSLKFHVSQKLYMMSKILWTINSDNLVQAKQELVDDRTINNVQSLIDSIKVKEAILLAERRRVSEANVKETVTLFWVGSFVIFSLFLVLFQYIRVSFKKRKVVEDDLLETNEQLKAISEENKLQNWILKGSTVIDEAMRGQREIHPLAASIIQSVCQYTHANIGAIYLATTSGSLKLEAGYAFDSDLYNLVIAPGDGLVGQVALGKEPYVLHNVPPNYLKIKSALGETSPKTILIQPIVFEGEVKGVLEIGFLNMPEITQIFIDHIMNNIAVSINSVQTMVQVQNLLEHSNFFVEELGD